MSEIQGIHFYGLAEGPYLNQPPPISAHCCQTSGMDFDRETERLAVAVHEAGHAVTAFAVGVHVPMVSITDPTENRPCGHRYEVTGELDDVRLVGSTVKQAMTILVAGERADERWLRETGLWTPDRGFFAERAALGDRDTARHVLADFGVPLRFGTSQPGSEDSADWWRYHRLADILLGDRWPQVIALAKRLTSVGLLGGDDAAKICGLPNPPLRPDGA